jgi:hypothetical protein
MSGVRVPDAVQRFFSGCTAEPGPRLSKQAGPRLCSAPLRKSYALHCVRGTRLRMQDHLAHRLAAREYLQRVGGLRQRKGAVDMR